MAQPPQRAPPPLTPRDLARAAADNFHAAEARQQNAASTHAADLPPPIRRSGAAEFMYGGAAATAMLRDTAERRKVARHRSAFLEDQDAFFALVTAQGTIRRFLHDSELATTAVEGRTPRLGKGATDHAILRALPAAKRREALRHIHSQPQATPLARLGQPKYVVDRSTLKFGKDKTSLFQ